jgi:hypothetical protein
MDRLASHRRPVRYALQQMQIEQFRHDHLHDHRQLRKIRRLDAEGRKILSSSSLTVIART